MTIARSIGPGWNRRIGPEPEPTAMASEIQTRRAEIAAQERADNECRYRKLVFAYSARDLNDAEVIELAALAEKLKLPANAPDMHRRAIRDLKAWEKAAAESFDLAALEKKKMDAYTAAREALSEAVADYFRAAPSLAVIEDAHRKIFYSCPWLQGQYAPKLPDRNLNELLEQASSARNALDRGTEQGPTAERAIAALRSAHKILWPED
jgi:hypothetical protein